MDLIRGSYSALILDLGGVVVDWDPRYYYETLGLPEIEVDYLLSEVCSPQWDAEQCKGRPYSAGVEQLSACYPEYAALIADFDIHWAAMIHGVVPGMNDLILDVVDNGVPLYSISNCPAEKYNDVRAAVPIVNLFTDVVVSGEVGVIKPDRRIYELALDRFGVRPDRCLFIDDSVPNVAAAEEIGMGGFLFKDSVSLREMLEQQLCKRRR